MEISPAKWTKTNVNSTRDDKEVGSMCWTDIFSITIWPSSDLSNNGSHQLDDPHQSWTSDTTKHIILMLRFCLP